MSSKILYVDDEQDLLNMASIIFEEEGFPIDTCDCIEKALDLISKNKYDLIITDLKMPGGSGIELITMARARGDFKGRVILVTGHFNPVDDSGMLDLVVFKPVDFVKLIDNAKLLLSLDL